MNRITKIIFVLLGLGLSAHYIFSSPVHLF